MFYNYEELKILIKSLNINTKEEYFKLNKNNFEKKIPSNPNKFYYNWENWSLFLNKPIYRKNFYNIYYSYVECKEEIKKLNLNTKEEYFDNINDIIKINNKIPYNPYEIYKSEWESWKIFLNSKRNKYSTGEKIISNILNELNIDFVYDKSFRDCKYIKKLKFDFKINLNNFYLLIEYDGEQHFIQKDIFGEEEFKNTLIRDRIKNEWCVTQPDVKLIRFNYKQKYEEIKEILLNNLK